MVFRVDRVSTYIASDSVNQGTEASRNNSSGGSNGNQGNTLPRTGGWSDFWLNGFKIDYNIFSTIWKFTSKIGTSNKDYRVVVNDDQYGEHKLYYAKWGTYEKLTGAYLDRYIDKHENNGTAVSVIGGGLIIGVASIAGTPIAGGVVGGIYSAGGIWTTQDLASDLRHCKNTTGVGYVRHHLISGSWVASFKLFSQKNDESFIGYTTVRCH